MNLRINGETKEFKTRDEAAQAAFLAVINGISVSYEPSQFSWFHGIIMPDSRFLLCEKFTEDLYYVTEFSIDARDRLVSPGEKKLCPVMQYRGGSKILWDDKFIKFHPRQYRYCMPDNN